MRRARVDAAVDDRQRRGQAWFSGSSSGVPSGRRFASSFGRDDDPPNR
jgi:hypothetical protein